MPGKALGARAARDRMKRTAFLLLVLCAPALAANFTDGEARRIQSHGPWPAPWTPDPSNRVSGNPSAIDLGERLFFERRLSANGGISCSRCHLPERNWSDGLPRAVGLAEVDRNAPSVVNVRYHRWFAWDGAHDSLWAQSISPILEPRELGMSAAGVAKFIRGDRDLACRYRKAFGAAPGADNEKILVDAAKALAAFQETLVSGRTAFDDFRDALARGDRTAMARYPENAQRGLKLFIGKGACDTCHAGPAFTDGEFHDTGIRSETDSGRYGGIRKLLADRMNLLGPYNDDPERSTAAGTRRVSLEQRDIGEFKVPSLRNLESSMPYMHNGSLASLRDVVKHYSEIGPDRLRQGGGAILKALHLTDGETADLVAFLQTLSDRGGQYRRRPFPE
ncbi:MAG TPA: cytochrome c peroxidase, partial [Burkholderiales bacterium]|nr:cytochrome c peroxidase [Burkholderiales bacterium]